MKAPDREAHLQAHIARLVKAGTKRNAQLAAAIERAEKAELDLRNLAVAHAQLRAENSLIKAELQSRGRGK